MKKFFLFLLAILGMAVNSFSGNYVSYEIKNLGTNGLQEKVSTKTVFLSKDKSMVSVINITQEQISKKGKNCSSLCIVITFDTIKTYFVPREIRKLVNDSNVITLLNTKVIQLPDSVFPRWTHIFGKDTVLRRNIKISNNQLILINKNDTVEPVHKYLIKMILIILLIVLTLNFISLSDVIESGWVLLGIGITMSIILFLFRGIDFPLFDVVLVSISLNLITIIFIVIKKIRKNKKKIHPIKMGLC